MSVVFTSATAAQLKRLPLYATDGESFCSVVRELSPSELKSFLSYLPDDAELQQLYQLAAFHFADVAHPRTRKWPVFTAAAVVDDHQVDCAPVTGVFSTTNGQRFVGTATGHITFLEFEHAYGCTVAAHFRRTLLPRIRRATAAMALADAKHPLRFRLACGTSEGVDMKTLIAYSEQSALAYAKRQAWSVLSTDIADEVNLNPE